MNTNLANFTATFRAEDRSVHMTTTIGALELTHAPDCAAVAAISRTTVHSDDDVLCDCYVSEVKLLSLPDGTETVCPHDEAQIRRMIRCYEDVAETRRAQLLHWKQQTAWQAGLATRWRGLGITMAVIAAAGWAVAAAQGFGWL